MSTDLERLEALLAEAGAVAMRLRQEQASKASCGRRASAVRRVEPPAEVPREAVLPTGGPRASLRVEVLEAPMSEGGAL